MKEAPSRALIRRRAIPTPVGTLGYVAKDFFWEWAKPKYPLPGSLKPSERRLLQGILKITKQAVQGASKGDILGDYGAYQASPPVRLVRGLKLAGVKKGTRFLDLGSGEGLPCFLAAGLYGAIATGAELNLHRYKKSIARKKALEQAGLISRSQVKLISTDFLSLDWSQFDIIYFASFGSTVSVDRMIEKARREMKPGAKLIILGQRATGSSLEYENCYDNFTALWVLPDFRFESFPGCSLLVFTRQSPAAGAEERPKLVPITWDYGKTHAEGLTAMDTVEPVWKEEGIWGTERWSMDIRPSTGTLLRGVFDLSFAVEDSAGKPAAYIYTTHGQPDYPVTQHYPGAFIFRLSVREDQKGRKLGPLLLLTSARAAKERGIGPYVTLETDEKNDQANHVYQSLGFKKVGERTGKNKPGIVFVEYAVPIDELIEKAEAQVAQRYGPEKSAAGLEEDRGLLAERLKRIAIQDQLQAVLRDLTRLGFTYQVLDQSLVEEFPEFAVLAELHQGIWIDRSRSPEETRALVTELISRSASRVNYYGYSERATWFRETAERALIKVEIPTPAKFQLLLAQLLANLSGLNSTNLLEGRLERMGLTLQRIASWLDQLA